jgi:hypothetical protein
MPMEYKRLALSRIVCLLRGIRFKKLSTLEMDLLVLRYDRGSAGDPFNAVYVSGTEDGYKEIWTEVVMALCGAPRAKLRP